MTGGTALVTFEALNLSREIERQSGGLLDQLGAAVDPRYTFVSSKRVAKR